MMYALDITQVQALLVVTAVAAVVSGVVMWFGLGSRRKAILGMFGLYSLFFGVMAAIGSPGGEARTTIEDGSYVVMSVVRTDETQDGGEAAFYNMLLIAGGEARYYRISHDVLEVDNDSKDSELRTLTVVSKQGLRKATLHYPLIGG